jgi:hypothetical protein
MYIQYIQSLFQYRLGTADYALLTSSLHYNDSLVTWTVVHMAAAKFKPLIFSVSGFALSTVHFHFHDFVWRLLEETHYISTTEPNRLMLFGETVAVYCENHIEHTDTVRTSQEPHYVSATEPKQLVLIREIIAFYYENPMKRRIHLMWRIKGRDLNVKSGGTNSCHSALNS